MKQLIFLIAVLALGMVASGQSAAPAFNFIEYQRSFPRINEALKKRQYSLMQEFRDKNLSWPAKNIYIRSFKYDSRLEVWVKYGSNEKYRLFKSYKVCAMAGTLGPKRIQGDYQVPEGFYYINEFNPRSMYHLSLGLNYPNASDRILADSLLPGGDIYIHGKCVTSGCIPIMDPQIEELYILAAHARNEGQDFIPVHIFPIDFKNESSSSYLAKFVKQFPEYGKLTKELKKAYEYFDRTKKLPVIMTGENGEYIIPNTIPDVEPEPETAKVEERRPIKTFDGIELATVVDKLPVFPGGSAGFQRFLNTAAKDMSKYLPNSQSRTYVMMEFIIDKTGKPVYAKVLSGGNPVINDNLQERFESMPDWIPATRHGVNVAIKLKQSIEIVR